MELAKKNNSSTDNQPVVTKILQEEQRRTSFKSTSVQKSKRISVYVNKKLNGKVNRALLVTRSNVNIISEQAY